MRRRQDTAAPPRHTPHMQREIPGRQGDRYIKRRNLAAILQPVHGRHQSKPARHHGNSGGACGPTSRCRRAGAAGGRDARSSRCCGAGRRGARSAGGRGAIAAPGCRGTCSAGGGGASAAPGCQGAPAPVVAPAPAKPPKTSGVQANGTDGGGGAQHCGLSLRNLSDLCQREALQGAPQNLFRSIQSQQSSQRQWRPEMDPEERWLLERMQQTSARVTPRRLGSRRERAEFSRRRSMPLARAASTSIRVALSIARGRG